MRKITRDTNIYEIRDRVIKVYLRKILRRFRQLNQSLLAFDEINGLSAVNACYDDVVQITVDALKDIAKRTYKWANGSDDGFMVDMWLVGWLDISDPVLHYKFYDEADRKRSRLFEALESVKTQAERKQQIDIGLRYWTKQFEQTADNLVDAVMSEVYKNNDIRYVMWVTMKDEKVCEDCYVRDGKLYPIDTDEVPPLHWNCRCHMIPIK